MRGQLNIYAKSIIVVVIIRKPAIYLQLHSIVVILLLVFTFIALVLMVASLSVHFFEHAQVLIHHLVDLSLVPCFFPVDGFDDGLR